MVRNSTPVPGWLAATVVAPCLNKPGPPMHRALSSTECGHGVSPKLSWRAWGSLNTVPRAIDRPAVPPPTVRWPLSVAPASSKRPGLTAESSGSHAGARRRPVPLLSLCPGSRPLIIFVRLHVSPLLRHLLREPGAHSLFIQTRGADTRPGELRTRVPCRAPHPGCAPRPESWASSRSWACSRPASLEGRGRRRGLEPGRSVGGWSLRDAWQVGTLRRSPGSSMDRTLRLPCVIWRRGGPALLCPLLPRALGMPCGCTVAWEVSEGSLCGTWRLISVLVALVLLCSTP